ncbi:MAG: response regulator [Pseudomonadota bacterium]
MDSEFRVLAVDDDAEILRFVGGGLERAGMRPHLARSVDEAEAILRAEAIDIIVLDLMMPGEDGLSFCKRHRASSAIPVIMLTALADDVDRIVGLEIGADDYLGKPFNTRELIARIKAVMRRGTNAATPREPTGSTVLCFGPYRFVAEEMSLTRASGETVHLTSGEFALLNALVYNAPRILSRDALLDLSRGENTHAFDRSIDSQISRLRSKIEGDPREPTMIKTVRNLGYAFSAKVTRASE